MTNRIFRLFRRGAAKSSPEFVPIYSFDELAAISRLPVVRLEHIVTARQVSDERVAGPGAGGVITNLLRRNLLLSRQLSVIGIEDTGTYADPLHEGVSPERPTIDDCEIVVQGRLRQLAGTTHCLQFWIHVPRDWSSACVAGACWEGDDWPNLVQLVKQRQVHADALCGMCRLDESDSRSLHLRHERGSNEPAAPVLSLPRNLGGKIPI